MSVAKNLFWFRRDLRVTDNQALYQALSDGPSICCFIWDKAILAKLKPDNPRVNFIQQSLIELKTKLNAYGSDLIIELGTPEKVLINLIKKFKIQSLYANEDYEPWAIIRDQNISELINLHNCNFKLFQDHLIFAKRQILNKTNQPYIMYTPYKNSWLKNLNNSSLLKAFPSEKILSNLVPIPLSASFNILKLSFIKEIQVLGGESGAKQRLESFIDHIDKYNLMRDYPAKIGTSHLGVDLRFGTISIRSLVGIALSRFNKGSEIWLNELIWREFFSQILYNFPYVVQEPFRHEYKQLKYHNNMNWFKNWCDGTTGYPIVDAGMRELNQTGFMHNRIRMVCASFLTKDLLIDWRFGEAYFADKLLDYELASNNGNWQWCASTGCDAQPYFRIFNPILQSKRFDPDGIYIKKYIPELKNVETKFIHEPENHSITYPKPIVNHSIQVKQALEMFRILKAKN